jgi:hypothetical protein
MNRKIALSGLSIVTALALLGGAAYAQFVVTAQATGNTFSSGNPALELCNDAPGPAPTTCGTSIGSPISLANLIPGVPQTFNFWLDNTGNDSLTSFTTLFNGISGSGSSATSGTNSLENDLSVSISCDSTSGNAAAGPAAFNVWESTVGLGGTLTSGAQSRCAITVQLPANNSLDANQILGFNATFGGQTAE